MIDERHEELAALHALDLLEGVEKSSFEAALARDPELQALVRELREASAALAHTAPAVEPPTALKARVLASVATKPASQAEAGNDNVIRPPLSVFRTMLPWAVAACFALTTAWFGQMYVSSRSEVSALHLEQSAAALSLRATEQQLAAERILASSQQKADAKQLAEARITIDLHEKQIASMQNEAAKSSSLVGTLTQRIDTLTGATTQLGRELGDEKQKVADAQQRVAALTTRLQLEANIANLKITALASKLGNSPDALAIAVWNPTQQQGILKVEKLPALAADKDYQLWVVDPQYTNPVDGGTFTVDPQTGEGRITFKSKQPIKDITAFAVTLERKGGVPKAEGPFVLLGTK